MKPGPKYLICGSRLAIADVVPLLRLLLEGLNTQARQWQETIVVLNDGSLRGLEDEVLSFRNLEHRRIEDWVRPNIVVAFLDRLSHNRDTEKTLRRAESEGIPTFVISTYGV